MSTNVSSVSEVERLRVIKKLQKRHDRYVTNRVVILEEARQRYAENTNGCRDRHLTYQNQYYLDHLEQVRASSRRHHELHHDEFLEYMRQRYYAKRPELRVKRLAYNATHKDEIGIYMYDYVREHPEINRNYRRRRRAWLTCSEGNFTDTEFGEKCEAYDNCCVYCNREDVLVADHAIPLSRSGSDNIENIVPACNSCNNKKHTMTYDEFVETLDTENRMRLLVWDYLEIHPEILVEEAK